jgi:hypothetical protein
VLLNIPEVEEMIPNNHKEGTDISGLIFREASKKQEILLLRVL